MDAQWRHPRRIVALASPRRCSNSDGDRLQPDSWSLWFNSPNFFYYGLVGNAPNMNNNNNKALAEIDTLTEVTFLNQPKPPKSLSYKQLLSVSSIKQASDFLSSKPLSKNTTKNKNNKPTKNYKPVKPTPQQKKSSNKRRNLSPVRKIWSKAQKRSPVKRRSPQKQTNPKKRRRN